MLVFPCNHTFITSEAECTSLTVNTVALAGGVRWNTGSHHCLSVSGDSDPSLYVEKEISKQVSMAKSVIV